VTPGSDAHIVTVNQARTQPHTLAHGTGGHLEDHHSAERTADQMVRPSGWNSRISRTYSAPVPPASSTTHRVVTGPSDNRPADPAAGNTPVSGMLVQYRNPVNRVDRDELPSGGRRRLMFRSHPANPVEGKTRFARLTVNGARDLMALIRCLFKALKVPRQISCSIHRQSRKSRLTFNRICRMGPEHQSAPAARRELVPDLRGSRDWRYCTNIPETGVLPAAGSAGLLSEARHNSMGRGTRWRNWPRYTSGYSRVPAGRSVPFDRRFVRRNGGLRDGPPVP